MREKPRHELIEELPSLKSLYKNATDYVSRLLLTGRFEPKFLLESDQTYAVSLCVAFLQHALDIGQSVLVIREAQLSDIFSLRTLLGWQLTGTPMNLIFEYTTDSGFLPNHEKVILRAAELRGSLSLYDVAKLSLTHLEQLIRSVRTGFVLNTEAYISWKGNLRSVLELKFRVGVGQQVALPANVPGLLANLERNISDHIDGLTPSQKLILAFIHANVEPLAQPVLQQQITTVDPLFQRARLPRLLEDLIDTHGFILRTGGAFRVHNETISQAIAVTPSMMAFTAIAERSLRDHYRNLIASRDFTAIGLAAAVRQVFRLCIATRDVAGLVSCCDELLDQVRLSQDQAIYVDAVCAAVDSDPELYRGEDEYLLMWAASLAYDTSNWERAADIMESTGSTCSFALALRAFSLQEIGRHDEALTFAQAIARTSTSIEEELIARLIEILVRGCRGETKFARAALVEIVDGPRYRDSALTGYALRFFDMVDGLTDALPRLEASVAWFDKAGLSKARAYSELSTAMLLARAGRGAEAQLRIAQAREVLDKEIRDQHIVLNNASAVELLSDDPDLEKCAEQLSLALRYVHDDFSELTVITNLALARWLNGELEAATLCATRMLDILRSHDFVDKNIFWPVCFNAVQVFDAAGRSDDSAVAIGLLEDNKTVSPNQNYWDYCFKRIAIPPKEYAFLATKEMHPIYISHWMVELEGLATLR